MQLRHLRYFVKIVEAGSFSRAAATIHVAQPALSQQIADLEARLGVPLLHRSARGARPTAAGEVLYREAVGIIRRIEELPALVRSTDGEVAGAVTLGMSSTLAASLAGPLMEACRATWPKVQLRFAAADSLTLRRRVETGQLDIGVLFEDDFPPGVDRLKLFRQILFLIRRRDPAAPAAVTLDALAAMPLILPAHPNITRSLIDRAFLAAGLQPEISAETDVLPNMLSAVQTGLGGTIIPKGDFSDIAGHANLQAIPITPALYLTASVAVAGRAPPSRAVEAVRALLAELVEMRFADAAPPGAEWLGG